MAAPGFRFLTTRPPAEPDAVDSDRSTASGSPSPQETEDGDDLNDDTFGDAASSGVHSERDFSAFGRPVGGHAGTRPLPFDPAVTMVRVRHSPPPEDAADDSRPPGLHEDAPPGGLRRCLTMEAIEAQLRHTKVSLTEEEVRRWFPVRSKKTPAITFPPSADATDTLEEDPRRGTMTRYEMEGISRIHLSQLTTENPEMEDFYYRAYAKRMARRRAQNVDPPLYLPLPTPRRQQGSKSAGRSAEASLARVLGKVSASSSKKPRQQLQVPSTAKVLSSAALGDVQFSLAASIERIYEAVFAVEDALLQESNTDYDQLLVQERRKHAVGVINAELFLDVPTEELAASDTLLLRFLALLATPKAKKIVGRAVKAIDSSTLSEALLGRIVAFFEYLDVCRHDVAEADVDLFVNAVLAPLVPFIAKCAGEAVAAKLSTLNAKSSLPWIATNKAGVVMCCILLSRIEILKTHQETTPPLDHPALGRLIESFYDQIQDRLSDVFANLTASDGDFYGWQFMALLAMNLDADRKRQIVMELRERILYVVQRNEPKSVANLNIFLNALGLDASQLSQAG